MVKWKYGEKLLMRRRLKSWKWILILPTNWYSLNRATVLIGTNKAKVPNVVLWTVLGQGRGSKNSITGNKFQNARKTENALEEQCYTRQGPRGSKNARTGIRESQSGITVNKK